MKYAVLIKERGSEEFYIGDYVQVENVSELEYRTDYMFKKFPEAYHIKFIEVKLKK